jgi:hypothetical protein
MDLAMEICDGRVSDIISSENPFRFNMLVGLPDILDYPSIQLI